MPPSRVFVHTLLALLTSFLLAAIFPGTHLQMLAPVALVPLLFVLANTGKAGTRFLLGWLSGAVFWGCLCPWIQFVLEAHGGMGVVGGWGCFILFCLYKGLHIAAFSLLVGPLLRAWYAVPAAAALWTGIERTHGTFGFAWLTLGNAGIDMSVPLRVAPWVGVYGLSFIFCMLSVAIVILALRLPRSRLLPLGALFLLWLLPAIPQRNPAADEAVVVQPAIDPELDWTPDLQDQAERHLRLLSSTLPAPLVIWPELPAPLYYYGDPQLRRFAQDIAVQHGAFLFETVAYEDLHRPLNSAVMLGSRGQEIGRYDQINLVPFGEYVPAMFSWVNKITKETSDFVPGHDVKVFSAAGHIFGTFICYESAFPGFVRQFTKAGADVLVNLSNDSYFGKSKAREQHLDLVRMRAVENRRFIIRATNDGITVVVDPAGRVVKRLPEYQEAAAVVKYGGLRRTTFYTEHGDWFAWGCLLVGGGLAIMQMVRDRRPTRTKDGQPELEAAR